MGTVWRRNAPVTVHSPDAVRDRFRWCLRRCHDRYV